jgi:hypothetical protein
MKYWETTLAILTALSASIALADDFRTISGKEYKHVTVSRVEPDGIVLRGKSGISKVYFTELPKEIQERFHYDREKAAAYSAGQTADQEALWKQQHEAERTRAEERAKYWSEHATPSPSQNNSLPNGSSDPHSQAAENPTPEQGPQNCYIEVRDVLSGLEIESHWETSWGSYDRDHFGRLILNIRLGTVGRSGGPMKIQWFWIGRKLSDINRLIVYGKGEKIVAVPAGYFAECYAAAPILKSHILNLAARGERYVSGVQHDGWIVCATDARDHTLAEKASSESLLNIFNDADQFSKLLSAK